MILSIIIPMYNAEAFIGTCLDNLLEQQLNLTEYEILVINDGSKDKSKKVVENYIKKYPNVILYNQKNSGNGAARNKGIDLAKGKYLYFLDSDDYIVTNVLNYLLNILEKQNLDILGFDSINTKSSNLKASKNIDEIQSAPDFKIIKGTKFIADNNYRAEVWWYIINTAFFKSTGISFYDRKYVQDSYITPSLFIKAERVLFLPLDIHRYRQNNNSITHIKSPTHIKKHMHDLVFSVNKLGVLIESIQSQKCVFRLKNRQQGYVFFFLIRFIKSNMSFKELKNNLKDLKSIQAYPITHFLGKDYNGLKYQVLVFIFNTSFLLYPFLYINRFFYRTIVKR